MGNDNSVACEPEEKSEEAPAQAEEAAQAPAEPTAVEEVC